MQWWWRDLLAGGHLGYPYGHLVDGTFDTLEDSLVDVVDYVRELEEKNDVKIPVIAGGGVLQPCGRGTADGTWRERCAGRH